MYFIITWNTAFLQKDQQCYSKQLQLLEPDFAFDSVPQDMCSLSFIDQIKNSVEIIFKHLSCNQCLYS